MKTMAFTGETPAEALKKVQEKLGDDAMVVSTKEIRKKTLAHSALYEVVAVVDESTKPAIKPARLNTVEDDVLFTISETAKQISEIANVANLPVRSAPKPADQTQPKPVVQTIIKDQVEIKEIQKEIVKLADRIKLIQNMVWDKDSSNRCNQMIPPEFAEIYRVSKQSGVLAEHLEELMRLTVEHMPMNMRQNSEMIRRYFNVILRKMIPVRVESRLNKPNKKVMMLVGPTGVGKTTTLAKLAARFAFKLSDQYKVGVITLDTYRIGAVDHLMYYAKMMRLGIESVQDPVDFTQALQSLKHCDYILIDTAGSSQHDKEKIAHIRKFLDSQNHTAIDVNLVVSAGSKLDDLRDIYKNYSPLGIDTIILTKIDETAAIGNIFSFVYETKKPLSYFTTGQEVPDDLLVADSDVFVSNMLDGFRKEREIK